MKVLRDINQIYDLMESMFKLNKSQSSDFKEKQISEIENNDSEFKGSFKKVSSFDNLLLNLEILKENNFAFQIVKEEIIKKFAEHIKNIEIQKSDVEKLYKLMYQLNNFDAILCNLVTLFLMAKKYEFIFIIICKLFVSHIGNQNYSSKNVSNSIERYFDRFIETVKFAKLQPEIYIPFLFKIFKSDKSENFSAWKNPALEYLQKFWNKNEKWFLEFIDKNPEDRYNIFSAILNFDSIKGVEYLINDYIQEKKLTTEETSNLIKIYKRDILFYIEKETPQAEAEKQAKFVEIMLKMDSDAEVMLRIKNIYENSKDTKIKGIISDFMGKSELLNKRTEKQFLNAVRNEIKEPQERVLNIPFNKFDLKFASGYPADNAVYTYFINLFKEEKNLNNIMKLSVLQKVFLSEGLHNMAQLLYNELILKPDIKQAKWCCRLVALLCNQKLEKEILSFIYSLFEKQRNKEGIYLTFCLIYCNKIEIISVIKKLLKVKNSYIFERIDKILQLISDKCNIEIDDIKDMLVPNEYNLEQFEKEKIRLYNAFLNEKMYTPKKFQNLFIENKLFNKLAQNLVFGEYKQGKLFNAFIIENQKVKFLVGESIFGLDDFIKNSSEDLNKNIDKIQENLNSLKSREDKTGENVNKVDEELFENQINSESENELNENDNDNDKVLNENIDISTNNIKKVSKIKMKDVEIGIIHPQDCDSRFSSIFEYFKNPTFNQFKSTRFSVKDYKNYCVTVSNFSGLLISPKSFCKFLTLKGFLINKFNEEKEFNSLVYTMPSLDIICEIEFNQLITENSSALANLGNICFYKLSDTLKANNKYIIKKGNSLNINSLPYRYFNYILSLVQEAILVK